MSLTQSIGFRRVTKNDVPCLYKMLNDLAGSKHFHPHPFDKKTLTQICNDKSDYYYVLLLNGKIIGYSMLRLFGTNIPSYGCYISRRYRGNGYGYLLTQWTVAEAKRMGYKKVILRVHKENHGAMSVYLKAGFKLLDTELKMECQL